MASNERDGICIAIDDGPLLKLPAEVEEAITFMVERHDLSVEQALGIAAVNNALLEDVVEDGGQLMLRYNDQYQLLEFAP